ncbi:hypothetical protein DSCOOX_61040 [Desulfosarcina ovata subsp. ovata]|uniref:Uncharacterized protein n=1 Tax=Desulfosarcina ovata subsp. ovata TaxID=2752305 RepID=A0A5K8AMS0_9BACT|nr:hypothetical protein DSCOOX_61040 [Desulfosarcina ovata subsp. ovata]
MQYALTSLGRKQYRMRDLEWFIGTPLLDVFTELLETKDNELPLKGLCGFTKKDIAVGGFLRAGFIKGFRRCCPGLKGTVQTFL